MSERRVGGDIAGGPDATVRRPETLVDDGVTARTDLDAGAVQPHLAGVRDPSYGDQDVTGLDPGAIVQLGGRAIERGHGDGGADVHTVGSEFGR